MFWCHLSITLSRVIRNELLGPRSTALGSSEPGPVQLGFLRPQPNGCCAPSIIWLPPPTAPSAHRPPLPTGPLFPPAPYTHSSYATQPLCLTPQTPSPATPLCPAHRFAQTTHSARTTSVHPTLCQPAGPSAPLFPPAPSTHSSFAT